MTCGDSMTLPLSRADSTLDLLMTAHSPDHMGERDPDRKWSTACMV